MTKKLLPLAATMLATTLLLAGCTVSEEPPTKPPATETPNSSGYKSAPETKKNVAYQADENGYGDPTAPDQAAEAAKVFPDVQATEGASKEEIQKALFSADMYLNQIFTDKFILSGQWQADGGSYEALAERYDRYWSPEYQGIVADSVNGYVDFAAEKGSDPSDPRFQSILKHLIPMNAELFGATTDNTKIDCTMNSSTCLASKNGGLVFLEKWSYQVANDGKRIVPTIKFQAPVAYVEGGKKGYLNYEYKVSLGMEVNPSADASAMQPAYHVIGVATEMSSLGWSELK